MSIQDALSDLQSVLEQSRYIDRVDNLPFKAGSPSCTITIVTGGQTQTTLYGKTRTMQLLEIKLTVKIAINPGALGDITKAIDAEIIKDRRRTNNAQTTVLNEEGWVPEETEGKKSMVISRGVEIHVYDN